MLEEAAKPPANSKENCNKYPRFTQIINKIRIAFLVFFVGTVATACTSEKTSAKPTNQAIAGVPLPTEVTSQPNSINSSNPIKENLAPSLIPISKSTPSPKGLKNESYEAVSSPKKAMYIASEKYIAQNPDQVSEIAEKYFKIKYADGSNICGPLAAAIMQDGGFLDPSLNVHEFWLLNDIESGEIARLAQLKEFFPEDKYIWLRSADSIAYFDHKDIAVGDLFYLKGGIPHWVAITKIDEQGRAYATTNIQQGYIDNNPKDETWIIAQDVLMHDPNNPESGQFMKWANGLGNLHKVGFKGFLQIRLK